MRSDEYGKFENGNKVSFGDFSKYFENVSGNSNSFQEKILPRMKEIARISLESVYNQLDPFRN